MALAKAGKPVMFTGGLRLAGFWGSEGGLGSAAAKRSGMLPNRPIICPSRLQRRHLSTPGSCTTPLPRHPAGGMVLPWTPADLAALPRRPISRFTC